MQRQQLWQQQQLQELASNPVSSGASALVNTAVSDPSSGSRRLLKAGRQVQPEDSALMHAAVDTGAGGTAGVGRASKLPQKAKHTLQLPPPQAPVVVMAVRAQAGPDPAPPAAARQAAAVQHKSSSMFDLPRSQGYTFSTAKTKAAVELSRSEQPATAQQPSCDTDGKLAGKQGKGAGSHNQQPQGNAAGASNSSKGGAAVKLQQPPASGQQQQLGSARAVGKSGSGSLVQGAKPVQCLPQPAAAATPPTQHQAQHQHSKYTSVLQQQDSFASQRSHGLSLRKGSRPSSPALQQAHTPASSRQQPLAQQQPQPQQQTPFSSRQQPLLEHKQPLLQQGPQPMQHSSLTKHSSSARGGARSVSPEPGRILRAATGSASRQRGGPGKPGSTAAGSVAAVAAVKAALAGFGARGWQQVVRAGLPMLQGHEDLQKSMGATSLQSSLSCEVLLLHALHRST
jgi:hypothetical protein